MTDKNKVLFPLRRHTLLAAMGASAAACLACPIAALGVLLIACIVGLLIGVAYVIVCSIAVVGIVGGGIAAVIGLFGEKPAAFVMGVMCILIGVGCSRLAPNLNLASSAFNTIVIPARAIIEWYCDSSWFLWSWLPATIALTVAGLTLVLVLLARKLPEWKRRLGRQFIDCPACHHRGQPKHLCPSCGAVENDLAPSRHGLVFARCDQCRGRLPTLDLLGRNSLQRKCGRCDSKLDNINIGRWPVTHVAVAHTVHTQISQTTLRLVNGQLVYLHDVCMGELACTRAASYHGFLRYLDRLVFWGDEQSLGRYYPHLAGIVGVIERATTSKTNGALRMPVIILRKRLESSTTDDRASEVLDRMHKYFKKVTTLDHD